MLLYHRSSIEPMSLITRDLLANHSSNQSNPHDLKLGMDHLERCTRSTNTNRATDQTVSKLQDLMSQPPLKLLDDTNLELRLESLSSSSSPPLYTLCKVKFALERAEKEHMKKRSISMSNSFEETSVDDEAYAAGCPSCLLYVLISRSNPKCPRCNMTLPPANMKKPRIDLNITI